MAKYYKLNAMIAIVFSMLIITTPFSSALLDWEEEEQEAQTGESILVNVKGYEPQVLPSSVVEDGDVPVYVYLTGTTPGTLIRSTSNAEPIYGSIDIKQVIIRPEDEETLNYVRGSPKYIKPREVTLDNLGYLIVTLKQIEKEADVPDEVKLNLKADITFENAERLYSMIEQDLIIPESPDETAWRQDPNFDKYRFFAGRGAIRASSISEDSAELTVYGGVDLQWPFTGSPRPLKDLELSEGETSEPIRMSAASDFMTNAFRVKLTGITDPTQKQAIIRVSVNGEEKEYIVTEGSRLYPGSSLTVKEINVVRDPRTNKVTYELVVRGPRDTSTASKSFFDKVAEGAATILGFVSEEAEEAARSAASLDQEGTAAATTSNPTPSETVAAESSEAATSQADSVNFVVMSDMHTSSDGGASLRANAVEGAIAQNPQFVVLTGDMVDGTSGTTADQANAMWNLFERETRSKLEEAGIMIIPLPGNHDLNNAALTNKYKAYWNEHKPSISFGTGSNYPLYYSFDVNGRHFVVLDSHTAELGTAQTKWLKSDLASAKAAGKKSFVFSHLPIEAIQKGGSGSYSSEIKPNAEIKTAIKENNVAAFINGDTHVFYEGITDGIHVISAGPVGGSRHPIPGTPTTTPYMIVPISVGSDGFVTSYGYMLSPKGTIFDENIFNAADVSGYTRWVQESVSSTSTPGESDLAEFLPGDEACYEAGGVCADSRTLTCYKDDSMKEKTEFVSGKCLSNSARWYKCCPSGIVATEIPEETIRSSIAVGAGEGVCKGKVVLFREGDTPDQWLELIKGSTQEMLHCTAAEEFKRVAELYFGIKDSQGVMYEDRAYFMLGEIYNWLGDTETALKYYRMSIRNNLGEFIPKAKSRITELEEDAAMHTRYKIAEFQENGVSVRVKIISIPFEEESEKPTATIDVEGEGTKKLKAGNGLFARDATETGSDGVARDYNWIVRDISSDSVVIEQKYRNAPPANYRQKVKALPVDENVRVDYGSSYKTAKLKSVDLKKYAVVTVIPGTGAPLVSQTNFTVHIPIEKRIIPRLTPAEISDKINSTQEIIADLDNVISDLTEVVRAWKKVCLVTFGYLTLKNSFFGGMSRTQARRFAMHGPDGNSGWDAYCRQNSGEGRLYEDYNECIAANSANIEATIDASQNAIDQVNTEMENYQNQRWYRNLTSSYTNLEKYEDYVGDDFFSPEELRDYRYWQLMRQSGVYRTLNGERTGEGYEYNLKAEVDSQLSSRTIGNEQKREAYLAAVSDVEAHYPEFDTLSEQDKATLFSDLYESHLAEPDTRSGDFPYVGFLIEPDPLSTIRREGRQLYSNTPHGRINLQEATVNDYQKAIADAMTSTSDKYMPELEEDLIEEAQRIERIYENNPSAPLRTNQGTVYVDDEGRLYVAMTTAYSTGQTREDYAPEATAEFYPDGKPYCVPTARGNYVKVLDFFQDGSPSVIQEWNVGTDGLLCTGDDVLVRHQSMLERPEMESTNARLLETASSAGRHSEGQVLSMAGRNFAVSTLRANSDASRSQASCYDVMDPDDCRMLFGVCDPVMCPPSRFNLGGAWQVNDVVQTGLIGSVFLGLHNFDIPYEPVPICLTGVLAGLQNIKSVLRGYVECLKTAQISGQSVGICDKVRSVFICELIWKEAMAILEMRGGILNWISETIMGQGGENGGGEYLTFESSIQNVEDSVSFFTSEYATTAFASYKSRSMDEIGTSICKQAIFGKLPDLGNFFDELATPESPPQYTALVNEMGYSETQGTSRYEIFYHIYAGEDNPATYSVFLKNSITNDVRYVTERCEGRQGSIDKGGIATFNLDCIAPSGYDNVCITLNGNTECGFGKVSTDFGLNYLSEMIVADEAQRNIQSEEDCVASAPRTSPTLGSLPMPGSVAVLSSGVQRVCSIQNPGQGTNPTDWREVGTCGKDSTGRFLGKCWIDMRTVTLHNTDTMEEVSEALDEIGFRKEREEMGIDMLEYEESIAELRRAEQIETKTCNGMANAMYAYKDIETRTISPKVAAEAGYKYAELMEKAANECAQEDPRRELTRFIDAFEYDLEAIYFEALDEFENDIAPYMSTAELPADFVQAYQEKVKALYNDYKGNLTEMGSRPGYDEALVAQYRKNFETLYTTAYEMNEPFVFKIEIEVEDMEQQIQIAENICNQCGSGLTNWCGKRTCHAQGMCYAVPSSLPFGDRGADCHACAKLTSCSELNGDSTMCTNQECTDLARNGEGMSCAFRDRKCVEIERRSRSADESTGSGSSTAEVASTGSSGTAIVPVTGMQIVYDTFGARTTGNVVDYGSYVDLDPFTQNLATVKSIMNEISARPAPDTSPSGASTFSEGTITATVYYTADCNDKPEWADGSKWYTGYWDDAETILAANPKECTSDAECKDGEECKEIGGKKVCWWQTPCKMKMDKPEYIGFYEETHCEGSSVCKDKVYSGGRGGNIGKEPFTGGVKKTAANEHGSTRTGVKPERHRTIAVNPDEGTQCFIPYGSRLYIKFNEGNPLNGWYVAEDTGGGFHGKCKIDMYGGVGISELNSFIRQNNKPTNKWKPEIWVYPPRASGSSATASTATSTTTTTTAAAGMCTSNSCCNTCRGVTYTSAKKVGVIGDSITNSTCRASETNSYVCYLNKQCDSGYDFYNYGVNGQTTARMKTRFQADILEHDFDEVIIMGGINNGNSAANIKADLQDMYTRAKNAGMRVIALTITPCKGHSECTAAKIAKNKEVNEWIMDRTNGARDVDIRVDVYSELEDPANPDALNPAYSAPDHLHLNAAGQQAIGRAVFQAAYRSACAA